MHFNSPDARAFVLYLDGNTHAHPAHSSGLLHATTQHTTLVQQTRHGTIITTTMAPRVFAPFQHRIVRANRVINIA